MTREELISLRKSLGISQDKMAKLLSYTRLHYHRIEKGIRTMPKDIKAHVKVSVERYLLARAQVLAEDMDRTMADIERIRKL